MPQSKAIEKALSLIKEDASKVLGLKLGKHSGVPPGHYVPRADAQSPPELFARGLSPSSTYLITSLDIDAPLPSLNVLSPILHWIQPEIKPTPSESDPDVYTLKGTAPFVANYIGPGPPPGSSPHRYVFILYEQPAGFDGSKYAPPNGENLTRLSRMRYDFDSWANEVGLGPAVAVNYFTSN